MKNCIVCDRAIEDGFVCEEHKDEDPGPYNEEIVCPGCGKQEFWFWEDLHDHMREECEYPDQARLLLTIEARCLKDPGGTEEHMLVEESRAVFIENDNTVSGEIRNCLYGGIEFVDRVNRCVWYIDRRTLIAAFAKAVK